MKSAHATTLAIAADTPPPMHAIGTRSRKQLAAAVETAMRRKIGVGLLDAQGKFRRRSHILVEGVDHKLLRESVLLERGSKAWWPASGLSLALNSFLAWRRCPDLLTFHGSGRIQDLRFGARCTTGIRGTPPQLDLLAMSETEVVAVTAEGPGYLTRRQARLAPAYKDFQLADDLRGWAGLAHMLALVPDHYRFVDAAALFKFAVGLARIFPDRACRLLYLYWEPEIGGTKPLFCDHRQEIEAVRQRVEGDRVRFEGLRFADIWAEWDSLSSPPWLPDLLARLRERYSVEIH